MFLGIYSVTGTFAINVTIEIVFQRRSEPESETGRGGGGEVRVPFPGVSNKRIYIVNADGCRVRQRGRWVIRVGEERHNSITMRVDWYMHTVAKKPCESLPRFIFILFLFYFFPPTGTLFPRGYASPENLSPIIKSSPQREPRLQRSMRTGRKRKSYWLARGGRVLSKNGRKRANRKNALRMAIYRRTGSAGTILPSHYVEGNKL